MNGSNGQLSSEADGDEASAPPPRPADVIEEIAAGGVLPFERLQALSAPGDETVAAVMTLWPRLEPERRRELLAALQQLSDEDATADFHRVHLTALRDPDAATRILAIRGLWEQDRVDYMRLLLGQLREDAEATVRATAAQVLGGWVVGAEFGMLDDDDTDHLCSTLREVVDEVTEDDHVRGSALEALGARSEDWVAELISEAYEAGTHRMRLASLRAMGRNAMDDWLSVLLYSFDDDDAEIRAAAASSAGQLLLDEAVEPLTALIDDAEEEVQVAAIGAIGEVGGQQAEQVLKGLLSRGEGHVVEAAREALAEARQLSAEAIEEESGGLEA